MYGGASLIQFSAFVWEQDRVPTLVSSETYVGILGLSA